MFSILSAASSLYRTLCRPASTAWRRSRAGPAADAVAAALALSPPLRPTDLCSAYASCFEGAAELSPRASAAPTSPSAASGGADADADADSRALLALVHAALDALNAASRAGCNEATDFLSAALHGGGSLLALLLRDEREARVAAEGILSEAAVARIERACERSSLIVTGPAAAKPAPLSPTLWQLPTRRAFGPTLTALPPPPSARSLVRGWQQGEQPRDEIRHESIDLHVEASEKAAMAAIQKLSDDAAASKAERDLLE